MVELRDPKIVNYLAKQFQIEAVSTVQNSVPRSLITIFSEEIDTKTLTGLQLKFVEFHNTLARFARSIFSKNQHQVNDVNKHKYNYKKFIENIGADNCIAASDLYSHIFIDVTYTINQLAMTGIPRVVTEIARIGVKHGVTLVILHDGQAYKFNSRHDQFEPILFNAGDIFFHPDAGWNYPNDLLNVLNSISQNGGKSVFMLYDVIPLLYNQLSDQPHVEAFRNWLSLGILKSDHILCISKAVADEFIILLHSYAKQDCSLRSVGWSHLGCDFNTTPSGYISDNVNSLISSRSPYFLSVGTIEPRKAYSVSIEAMEKLWKQGIDANFVIVGKYGWSQLNTKEKILNHAEYQKRLFWFDNSTDFELKQLYIHAHLLISTSLCEGFGLPLTEAAYFGLPEIVSDIPVFREIGGNSTKYFEVTNSDILSRLLFDSLSRNKLKPDVNIISWSQAAKNLLNLIANSDYQYLI